MRNYRKEHLDLREEIVFYAGLENCLADGEDIEDQTDLDPIQLEDHTNSLVKKLEVLFKEMNVSINDQDILEIMTEGSYNQHIQKAMKNRHRGILKITSLGR